VKKLNLITTEVSKDNGDDGKELQKEWAESLASLASGIDPFLDFFNNPTL
jgi:hypothetical protein